MNSIIAYLLDKSPAIVALFVVGFIVWKVAAFYFTRFKKTEEHVSRLPCDQHGVKIDKQKSNIKQIREKTTSIDDKVTVIAEWIMRQDKKTIHSLGAKKSPTTLTDAGWEFLRMSGGQASIDGNLDFFISELDKTCPSRPYDVEEGARHVLLGSTGNDAFNGIKDFIYYSPEIITVNDAEIEVSLFSVIFVMSIYLRDKYLDKYPEIIREATTA